MRRRDARRARTTLLVCIAAALAGCGAEEERAPRLSEVQAAVFSRSCVFSSCHKGASPAAGMSLEPPVFDSLVERPSTEVPARFRVVPGDPSASYLMEKLTTVTPSMGDRMPPTDSLSEEKIDLVRRWIAAGAEDD